jgi:hypothetical protein
VANAATLSTAMASDKSSNGEADEPESTSLATSSADALPQNGSLTAAARSVSDQPPDGTLVPWLPGMQQWPQQNLPKPNTNGSLVRRLVSGLIKPAFFLPGFSPAPSASMMPAAKRPRGLTQVVVGRGIE